MKLSQMTTDQLADTMILIAEPVSNIAQDNAVEDAFKTIASKQKEGATNVRMFGILVKKIVPVALKSHRKDLYAVISALTGKSVEDIGSQQAAQTIKDCSDIIDKELIDFFKSSAGMEPSE